MENFAQLEYVMILLIVSIILTIGLALIGIKIAPEIGLMDFPGNLKKRSLRYARIEASRGGVMTE